MKNILCIICLGFLVYPSYVRAQSAFQPYNTQGDNLIHVATADFDAVGTKDYVIGMTVEGKVIAFERPSMIVDPDADNRLWEYQTPCSFNTMIDAGEADSNSPGDEILVPGTDGHLRILSSEGALLADWELLPDALYCVGVGATSNGSIRIVTGGVDGYMRVLDENGTVLHEERPGKWGAMKSVTVGNYDGVGGDEAIIFYQSGGFFAPDYFLIVDLDTLQLPSYWESGTNTCDVRWFTHAYDMDGDGDDELVGSWGVLHPENGAGTHVISTLLAPGEALSSSDYEDFEESTKMSYPTERSVPGNFRDWADHPGAELLRSRGINLHMSNYDTNRSVDIDRLRLTDYGYSHALYHFMSIARLENRNGELDRVVLSGTSNGDDHFYVVDLSGSQWKTDGKYIDGRGVLGAVRDTYDALDADLGAFSGTVANGGKPIWYIDFFSSYLGTWDKTDPVEVASRADDVAASMSDFNARVFGPGYEPQRINLTASLSLTTDGNVVEPGSINGLENFTAALAQRGAHFCLKIGHGDNVFIDPNHLADIFETSIYEGHCYMMARTRELSEPEDTDVYKPHLDALMARAQSLGVNPPKVVLCQKGAIWSVMEPAQYATYFPAYKDIIVPGVENSNVTEHEWTIAERTGLWLHGDVEAWGCDLIGDLLTPNREVIGAGDMRNGHVVLRHLLSQYALGATICRITSIQSWTNPLYERDGIGPEFGNVFRQGIYPFLKLVEAGVYPNGPDRSQLKGVSPVAVALYNQNRDRLLEITYNREFDFYTPSTNNYVLDKVACWAAYTDVPDFDLTAIMHNSERRWHNLLPNSAAGFVPMIPFADRSDVESNAWCTRAYQTDGDTWSDFADLETARDTLGAELMSARSNMLFYVDGECFWQVTQQANDPNILFAVLMDSNVLTPTERMVNLKRGNASGAWNVYDQFGSQWTPLGTLTSASDQISITIPAGSVRILTIKRKAASKMVIAWHSPGVTAQDNPASDATPDEVLPGVTGLLSGGRDCVGYFNSTDSTYGNLAGYVIPPTATNAIRVRTKGIENQVTLSLSNVSAAEITLDTFHFDFGGYDGAPLNFELVYDSGDLNDADGTSVATGTRPLGIGRTGDYADYSIKFSPAMSDLILAGGESATFRLDFSNAVSDTLASAVDNLAITLAGASNPPDINGDGDINFEDFGFMSWHWLLPCSDPNWCEGADLNISGNIDLNDVRDFAESWLGLP